MVEALSEILGDQGTRKRPASVGGALLPRSKQERQHRRRPVPRVAPRTPDENGQGGTWRKFITIAPRKTGRAIHVTKEVFDPSMPVWASSTAPLRRGFLVGSQIGRASCRERV